MLLVGIGFGPVDRLDVFPQRRGIRVSLLAPVVFTCIWLFTGMSSILMLGSVRGIGESFRTSWKLALIGLFTRVWPQMGLEILESGIRFGTSLECTPMWLLSRMSPHVDHEHVLCLEWLFGHENSLSSNRWMTFCYRECDHCRCVWPDLPGRRIRGNTFSHLQLVSMISSPVSSSLSSSFRWWWELLKWLLFKWWWWLLLLLADLGWVSRWLKTSVSGTTAPSSVMAILAWNTWGCHEWVSSSTAIVMLMVGSGWREPFSVSFFHQSLVDCWWDNINWWLPMMRMVSSSGHSWFGWRVLLKSEMNDVTERIWNWWTSDRHSWMRVDGKNNEVWMPRQGMSDHSGRWTSTRVPLAMELRNGAEIGTSNGAEIDSGIRLEIIPHQCSNDHKIRWHLSHEMPTEIASWERSARIWWAPLIDRKVNSRALFSVRVQEGNRSMEIWRTRRLTLDGLLGPRELQSNSSLRPRERRRQNCGSQQVNPWAAATVACCTSLAWWLRTWDTYAAASWALADAANSGLKFRKWGDEWRLP